MSSLGLEHVEPLAAEPAAPSSALERIRRLYKQAVDEQTVDLPVPRNPIMGVRYGPLEDFQSSGTTAQERNVDFLVAACRSILVRDGKRWEPLTHNGLPVVFDETLVEILDLDVPSAEEGGTARQVVLEVFKRAPVPHAAIALQVDRLSDWMAGETSTVDEEALLGES